MKFEDASSEIDLKSRIIESWSAMPVPLTEELTLVREEEGESVFALFAGKKPTEVDRESGALEDGHPLLFMSTNAAAAYIAVYLLSLLDNMPAHKESRFVFDQRSMSHLFGMLSDRTFVDDLKGHLDKGRQNLVAEFILSCVKFGELLSLSNQERASLIENAGRLNQTM